MLAWCAVCAWFAFVRDSRVPLLGLVDLGFHELGHLVMYVLPIHDLLTAAMGSIFQIAVPFGLAVYFAWVRRDMVAAAVCTAWTATNLRDVAVYVGDAPYERLELIGGEHDWAFVLGSEGLDRLDDAAMLASMLRGAGVVLLGIAVVLALWHLTGPDQCASASPGRGHGIDTSRPVPDSVTNAVRRSSPPKQTFVTSGSPTPYWSTTSPDGEITLTTPAASVATTTFPSPSIASESKSWRPGRPQTSVPPCAASDNAGASSPGPETAHDQTRPV